MRDSILEVNNLQVSFDIGGRDAVAVDRLSFSLGHGRTLGIVGESGSGKSIASLAIMGLVPSPPGRISGGSIRFMGRELTGMPEHELRALRGKDISMIFQEPMTALNPVFRVGEQIAESLMVHANLDRRAAWGRAAELLAEVGIPEPELRVRNYPFELSGGMRQRVMIAIALACAPSTDHRAGRFSAGADLSVAQGNPAAFRHFHPVYHARHGLHCRHDGPGDCDVRGLLRGGGKHTGNPAGSPPSVYAGPDRLHAPSGSPGRQEKRIPARNPRHGARHHGHRSKLRFRAALFPGRTALFQGAPLCRGIRRRPPRGLLQRRP